jgi:deferrochelatase/peroxidase EfeB
VGTGIGQLELDKIQGNVVPGFSKDHQAFMLVRYGGLEQGRGWLELIEKDLASAAEAATFKSMFTTARGRLTATWVNVGLSFEGLRTLVGSQAAARFPAAFRRNRPPGFDVDAPGGNVDAILIVAADRPEDLQAELNRQREHLSRVGALEVQTFCGSTLPDDARGHEHFGFKDAISQPHVAGTSWGTGPEIAAGEFVLGHPDEAGQISGATLPAWAQNGSFLAFVQLQQHVEAFRRAMKDIAAQLRVAPDEVAAWIVGRDTAGEALASRQPASPTSAARTRAGCRMQIAIASCAAVSLMVHRWRRGNPTMARIEGCFSWPTRRTSSGSSNTSGAAGSTQRTFHCPRPVEMGWLDRSTRQSRGRGHPRKGLDRQSRRDEVRGEGW